MIEPAFHAHVLAGTDASNIILRESHRRQASPAEYHAAPGEIEVQVVKAVLLAMVGKVVHVNRVQVEEEHRFGVGAGARLLDVDQRVFAERYIKVCADCRFAGYQRLVVRTDRRFEGLFGVCNQRDIDIFGKRSGGCPALVCCMTALSSARVTRSAFSYWPCFQEIPNGAVDTA